jgi:hypothetical protein
MKKLFLIATFVGFGIFVVVGQQSQLFGSNNPDTFPKLPSQPNFAVSHEFDGQWIGRRVDVSGNNMCSKTTITGIVAEGFAQFTLTYNGTPLKGWIESSEGGLVLYATNNQWDYRFTGKASGNRISGEWHLKNGICKGSWYLEKQS